jgi:rhodanese-related sulfurtransferase
LRPGITVPIVFAVIIAAYLFTLNGQNSSEKELTVQQVRGKAESDTNIVLIDVRTPSEFDGTLGHLSGSILIPLAELSSRVDEIEKYRDKEVIMICMSGYRSGRATDMLRELGFNAVNMAGGMRAWNKMMKSIKIDTVEVKNEGSTQ